MIRKILSIQWLLTLCCVALLCAGCNQADIPNPTQTQPSQPTVSEGPELPDGLEITDGLVYSGVFWEDGNPRTVSNCAAVFVKNTSKKYLDFGSITYKIQNFQAVFEVKGLPPGCGAWVVEKTALSISEGAEFVYQDATVSFRPHTDPTEINLSVSYEDGVLTAQNHDIRDMKDVTVYYKRVHSDGNFFGGFCYMRSFGDIPSGESARISTENFDPKTWKIVKIECNYQ